MRSEILRIGICDDEIEDLIYIKEELHRYMDSIGVKNTDIQLFEKAEMLCEESCKQVFKLLLLDLEMPGYNGFQLARLLSRNSPETKIIFVSYHENMVFDSYEYMPLWFVRKSRLEWDLHRALQKYFSLTISKRIKFKTEKGFRHRDVILNDIVYIEGNGHRLTVVMADKESYEVYGSLKTMEGELSQDGFLRIHKNYLVNKSYIRAVGRRTVCLFDRTELDMGRNRRKAIIEEMGRYGWQKY